MIEDIIERLVIDYRTIVENMVAAEHIDTAVFCFKQALKDVLLLRKSKYRMLEGTEKLPEQIGFLRFNGDRCYIDSHKKDATILKMSTKRKMIRTLLYLLEYEEETFTPEEITAKNGYAKDIVKHGVWCIKKKLEEAGIDYVILKSGRAPTRYGLQRKNAEDRKNFIDEKTNKIFEHYKILLKPEGIITTDNMYQQIKNIVNIHLSKPARSRYKMLGGNEDLPESIGDIYFSNGRVYIGKTEKTKHLYGNGFREASGIARVLVYLVEHQDQTFTKEDLVKIGDFDIGGIRQNMHLIKQLLTKKSKTFELYTEKQGRNVRNYGIRRKLHN